MIYVPLNRFEESTAKKSGIILFAFGICCFILDVLSYDSLGPKRFTALVIICVLFMIIGIMCVFYQKSLSVCIKLTSTDPRKKRRLIYGILIIVTLLVDFSVFVIVGCMECAGIFLGCVLGIIVLVLVFCFMCKSKINILSTSEKQSTPFLKLEEDNENFVIGTEEEEEKEIRPENEDVVEDSNDQ